MDTVVRGRTAPGSVKQIHDPRFAVTGGDMGGIVPLVKLQGATTVGYIYGGIISAATNAQGESTASNVVFKVVITPA
jgi:hypothetical protein